MVNELKKFLNEEQDPKAVEKIHHKVKGLLTNGENIEYIAVQKKAINLSPDCIALTNKRIIFCRPKTFGLSMNFQDYLWKDIANCHMKEGVLGATFSIQTVRRAYNMMDYLPKAQARKLYQYAQEREEEMMEYRRQRELEDKRAAAGGGIIVNNALPTNDVKNIDSLNNDPMNALEKLKSLLDANLISHEEFNKKKEEILSRL